MRKVESREEIDPLEEQMEIKDDESNSLLLLIESLKLSAEKAIPMLEKAMLYAPNNLSAAEYLSYLYLDTDRPIDCLKVCNKMIDTFEDAPGSAEISYHIFNNKACALNQLGRAS